jgi:signal transduction histidine kinase
MATKITEDLRKDRKTLRQIVQGSPIPTFVINAHHMVIHWNRALEKLCGHSAAEMLGTRRQWVIYQAGERPTMADAIIAGEPVGKMKPYYGGHISPSELIESAFEAEAFFPNMGENGKWLFITAAPIFQANGKIAGAIETLWDKTDEKRAAIEREHRNMELSALCAVSDALCGSTSIEKRLAAASQEIIKLLSVDVIGIFCLGMDGKFQPIYTTGLDNKHYHPRLSDNLVALLKKGIEKGEITSLECIADIDGNDGAFWAGEELKSISLIPLRAEEVCGIMLLGSKGFSKFSQGGKNIMDLVGNRIGAVVENSRLHQQLIDSERMAAIGQTAAGLAHCIKNILMGLKGGSYILDVGFNKNDTEKMVTGWQVVKANIGRVSGLVTDLLSFSKERTPEYQKCFPNRIIHEICVLLEEEAKRNGIKLIEDFDASIGEILLDNQTVHRSMLNLVSNAIDACMLDEKHGKHHQITVKTIFERKGLVRFETHDNGVGMDDEVINKLFTSLFSTKGGKGTGIGLLVTKKLIQEHNGTIDVTSQPGKGSVFTIRLPYEASD